MFLRHHGHLQSTELMDYRSFVKYAVFCCLVAQDRGDIKKQVKAVELK